MLFESTHKKNIRLRKSWKIKFYYKRNDCFVEKFFNRQNVKLFIQILNVVIAVFNKD